MQVVKQEGNILFDVKVDYLQPNYYKVRLQNKANNNVQVILKNNDGVFVITPALNKQFQFKSDWPLNSSHAYLYQSIIKDITNDPESSFVTNDDSYTVKSKVDSKTNAKFNSQKSTFDKKTHNLISNTIYDANDNMMVMVEVKSFKTDTNLKVNDFNADVVNNTIKLEMSEGVLQKELTECVPTFLPEGYTLSKSIIKEEYTLYTYKNNESVYTISTIVSDVSDVLTVSREFEDMVLLESGVGFVNEKSLSFFQENLFVSIYNENFNLEEATLIANSFNLE